MPRERLHEVTRLEGFSDAVFGFALTLLVVSLDVPKNVDDLLDMLRGLLPFALMFSMIFARVKPRQAAGRLLEGAASGVFSFDLNNS